MRHKNGNCLPAGGFCTAINKIGCVALQKAYSAGKRDAYVVRPKSEWIVTIEEIEGTHFKHKVIQCAKCGYYADAEYYFCPTCGAEMDINNK